MIFITYFYPKLFTKIISTLKIKSWNKPVMADKFVAAMASALQEYDANHTLPYQLYEDLAWGGLSAAPIFVKTYPPGSAESIRIKNRYAAESVGFIVG